MKNNHGNNQSNNQNKRNQKTNKKHYARKPRHRDHSVLAKRTELNQSFAKSDVQAKTYLPGGNNPADKQHWNFKGFQLKKIWKQEGESQSKTIKSADNRKLEQSGNYKDAGESGFKSGIKTESKLSDHKKSDPRVNETSLPNKQLNSASSNNINQFSNKVSRLKKLSNNPRMTGAVAAVLLFVMLVAAIIPATQNVRAEETETAALNPTMQLAKEYIYAGSRMLAIEDYGLSSTSTPTPTPTETPTETPTPTITPTPTPPVSSEAVIWQNVQGTTINGSAVEHAGTNYFGQARSQQTITTSGYFEWSHSGDSHVVVGLGNNDDEQPDDYSSTPYAFGNEIRENGVYKADVYPAVGDTLRIEIDNNGTVLYKRNGTVVYTSETPASGAYYLLFKSSEIAGQGISSATAGSISPTPTPTPTITPTPDGGQGIVFDGTNYGLVTLPNAAPFNSLGGFQMIWRVRDAHIPEGTDLPGYVFSTDWFDLYAAESEDPVGNPSRFDVGIEPRAGDTFEGLYMIPTNFSDSVCKLQYDPANSRWTFETWKSDGTGYVLRTINIQNVSDYNLGGLVMGIGAKNYENRPLKGKLDYWRWIQRVEPLGVFPSAQAPTGVTYLLDYEFEGNGNDSSGNGLNLTLTNNPTFENTP